LIAPLVVACVGWLVQAAVLVGGLSPRGAAVYDEREFHLPTVAQFAAEMPTPDLSDYPVATSPGHHLALAGLVAWLDPGVAALRGASGQSAVALAAAVAWWASRRGGAVLGIVSGLLLLLSHSIAPQLVMALPEASAWLLVAMVIGMGMHGVHGPGRLMTAGACVTLLVFVRHVHLWAAAVVWLSAWLGRPGADEPEHLLPKLSALRPRQRVPRTLAAMLATLPAFAVVGWLFWLWDGPVPPGFQAHGGRGDGASIHSGGNPATPALVLASFGLYAPLALLPAWWAIKTTPGALPRALRLGGAIAAVGMIAALAVPTVFDKPAGRWGGLWNLARSAPAIADRSLLIAALAAAGGACLGAALSAIRSRERIILLGAMSAFITAQSANHQAWMRYVEPFVLIVITALNALSWRAGVTPRWTVLGPSLLALGLAASSMPELLGL
jgi:hypothetical protein